MKRLSVFLCAMVLVFGVVGTANSALIDRGGGLIYDDVLDVTWLQDANYAKTSGYDPSGQMSWEHAVSWADGLKYYDSVRDKTWTDWRLPKTLPVNGISYDYIVNYSDGSTDRGFNISAPGSAYPGSTASEMAYMYYNNLGNLGYCAIDGTLLQPGWGLVNTGPFNNLNDDYYKYYWSGSDYLEPSMIGAWIFYFKQGSQGSAGRSNYFYSWAVMDGDVAAVPIPSAIWLLGSAFIGLLGFRRKFRKS